MTWFRCQELLVTPKGGRMHMFGLQHAERTYIMNISDGGERDLEGERMGGPWIRHSPPRVHRLRAACLAQADLAAAASSSLLQDRLL
eukprot:431182-Pyramimonas_sp.AAC.1